MNSSCALLFDRQSRPPPGQVVIAIPVRDEAARIGSLLGALARAASRCPLPVTALVLANNCRDRTGAIARAFSCPPLRMEVHEIAFPDDQASAGRARRAAMELACVDTPGLASVIFGLSAGSSIGRVSGLSAWPSTTPRAGMLFGRLGSHRFRELHALEPRD